MAGRTGHCASMTDEAENTERTTGRHVGLFATCLVDLMRPSVGFAAARLLERAGYRVSVPESQTCCGQPAYNAGDQKDARAIAAHTIAAFEPFDYVIAPSGSCAAMIRVHYPRLFEDEPEYLKRSQALAEKTYELTSFLSDIAKTTEITAKYPAKATYHDACSGLREMAVRAQPRALLAGVSGLRLVEAEDGESCCGFGGLFSVKYPDISASMVDDKVDALLATGADVVLGGDLGCLINIAGRLKRRGASMDVRHVAEVLAGMTDDVPPIAGSKEKP